MLAWVAMLIGVKASACSTGHDPWFLGHKKLGTVVVQHLPRFADFCLTRVLSPTDFPEHEVCLSLLQGRSRSQEGPGSQWAHVFPMQTYSDCHLVRVTEAWIGSVFFVIIVDRSINRCHWWVRLTTMSRRSMSPVKRCDMMRLSEPDLMASGTQINRDRLRFEIWQSLQCFATSRSGFSSVEMLRSFCVLYLRCYLCVISTIICLTFAFDQTSFAWKSPSATRGQDRRSVEAVASSPWKRSKVHVWHLQVDYFSFSA